MATTTPIKITILGDASNAQKALRDTDNELGGFAGKAGGHLGKVTALLGGAFAGFQAIGLIKGGIDSLTNMSRIAEQTAAVVKSTGGAAGVTADQVSDYANAMERATGIEAENIQTGQNMLLTFTNVKNGVGAGNDIFNQASKTMVDLATAMGGDTQGAAIQLGKALNDPTKGITALTKVGVTFTDQQKAQIKAMQESGDTAGAQKVILAELTKEFGGSAEAFGNSGAGKIAKFKNELGNLQDEIASAVLPVLEAVTGWLAQHLPQAVDFVSAAFTRWSPTMHEIVDVIVAVYHGVQDFVSGLLKGTDDIGTTQTVIASWGAVVRGVFFEVHDWIMKILPQVQEAIGHFVNAGLAFWHLFGDDIMRVTRGVFEIVQAIITTAINVIKGVIQLGLAIINGDWGKAWSSLRGIVSAVWDGIKGVVSGSINAIIGVLGGAGALIGRATSGMWDGIKNAFRAAINFVIRGWNSLQFTTPKVHIPGTNTDIGGEHFGTPHINELYTGGVGRGWTWVGERGPELVNFGSPSRVLSNADSIAAAGGSSRPINLEVTNNINVSGEVTDDTIRKIEQMLKEHDEQLMRDLEAHR